MVKTTVVINRTKDYSPKIIRIKSTNFVERFKKWTVMMMMMHIKNMKNISRICPHLFNAFNIHSARK